PNLLIDVYQAWCGPCKAVVNLFRKLKNEHGEDDLLHFAVAEADSIVTLQTFRDKCEPVFLFCVDGKIIAIVRGTNAPLLSKTIIKLLEEERKILAGEIERPQITEAGFGIAAEEEKTLTEEQVRDFYSRSTEQMYYLSLISLQEVLESENMLNLCDVEDSIENASRQLAFFFPDFGRKKTSKNAEKTLALIRPSLLKERRNSILKRIKDDGFTIAMQKEIVLTEEQAHQFYKEHENEDFFPTLLEHMTSGPTLALALIRENAVQHWRDLLGPKTLEESKEKSPASLRSEYAVDSVPLNQLHGSASPGQAEKELEFFFPVEHTLAVIKPTAVKEHKDDIMQKVTNAGFIVSQMKETNFTREMATQFYKAHEGKPFFDQLVNYMSEGPSVIMILTKENAVEEWRQLMGPTDPDVAKESSPDSLRAQFAQDILRNAVHGSSNKEHALKSIEYVFGEIDLNSLSHN
uniref:NME/NM23 family member 8 n=1 Tax=Gopherus evgoodei TaxID=1825980 RepID=A0A8C4W152_9SAUR